MSGGDIRERLRDLAHNLEHLLPAQAPIRDFVHHNTLHGFQHLPFRAALVAAGELGGASAWLPESTCREYWRRGRIDDADLRHALAILFPDDDAAGREVDLIALIHGAAPLSPQQLAWEIDENAACERFQGDVPATARARLLAAADKPSGAVAELWQACRELVGANVAAPVAGQVGERAAAAPELAVAAEAISDALWQRVGVDLTWRGLLLALTGEDLMDELRPLLVRSVGAHLDHGLAAWHAPQRQDGLFAAWRASAVADLQRSLEVGTELRTLAASLPDNGLDALLVLLPRTRLAEDLWPGYLTRLALELPGWAGMVLWRQQRPGYVSGATAAPIDIVDYLAVHLACEQLIASRLVQRTWGLTARFDVLRWYFRDHPAEAIVRQARYAAPLGATPPEALSDAAQQLIVIGRVPAEEDAPEWSRLAGEILAWRARAEADDGRDAWPLFRLAQHLGLAAGALRAAGAAGARALLARLARLDADSRGEVWLLAYERHYREQILAALAGNRKRRGDICANLSKRVHDVLPPLSTETPGRVQGEGWGGDGETVISVSCKQAPHPPPNLPLREAHPEGCEGGGTRSSKLALTAKNGTRPAAQLVFCMDDREEGFRRHLEEVNPKLETFGVAGFFGIAMAWTGVDDSTSSAQCPVVVTPAHAVREVAAAGHAEDLARRRRRRRQRLRWKAALFQGSRQGALAAAVIGALAAPFALLALVGKLIVPGRAGRLARRAMQRFDHAATTRAEFAAPDASLPASPAAPRAGFTDAEQAERIAGTLRAIGLVGPFAPLVVVMGHGSHSENNPHRSAYDCGACSGRHGGPNARVFAAMANRPEVRARLAERGLVIADETRFIGAEHDTGDDSVSWFDADLLPASHRPWLAGLRRDLDAAGRRHAQERCRRFASAASDIDAEAALDHVAARCDDFAQARPELGHVTNACAVIGRRRMTRGCFLDRRAFLISYDPDIDGDGAILEGILLAAGPVGAGISLEYYFSTVNNERYGCSTKIMHNLAGLLGVMEGACSDLRTGLPQQMIEIHEAMRLLIVCEALPATLSRIVARQPALQELIGNGWVQLAAQEPDNGRLHVFTPERGWQAWTPPAAPLPQVRNSREWFAGRRDALPPALVGGAA